MKSSIERYTKLIVIGSIAAVLVGGLAVLTERVIGKPIFDTINQFLSALSSIWTTLFIVVTVPLVFVFILRAILAIGNSKLLGQIGIYALVLHFIFALSAFFLVVVVDDMLLPVLFPEHFSDVGQLEDADALTAGLSGLRILLDWSDQLRVIAIGIIQPALLSAIVLALAGLLFFRKRSHNLLLPLDKLATWILEAVYMLLLFMPVAMLSVVFSIFKEYGVGLFATFALFIVYQVLFILVFIGLLYVAGYLFASIKPRRLFNAMIPTYFVAVSTRSSYACVACTTESGHKALGYQEDIIDSTIPFFLITFRANRAITSIMTFQFLAHCFGSDPEWGMIASMLVFTMLATIGSPGLPGSVRFTTLPYYVAAGIPIQAYMFSKVIDDIPDYFKTVLNVTYPVVLLGLVMNLKNALDKYILKA